MPQTIVIDPVTRIEGHAKITIQLDEAGEVENAHFHVTQVRGFEKFVEGRPFHEMPSLMARICGICPVSHLVASAKACDALLAVRIPETAANLRRVLNLAQIIQSHALSFFYLSSPDLLLGMDADPAERNLFGVARAQPELARDGVRLRQIGQQIIELLGGKRIHPAWVVPGGVSAPLSPEKRETMLAMIPEGIAIAERTLAWYRDALRGYDEEIAAFSTLKTAFMGLVTEDDALEMYDGTLRVVDQNRQIIADHLDPADYASYIGEAVEPHSYLKSPYYKPLGYPDGIYRVGPLARLNIVSSCGTPRADAALQAFREVDYQSSFHYHYARLIEILYGFEKIDQLLHDEEILSDRVRAHALPNNNEGVGMSEAPRGTLLHHYEIDRDGLITRANLIIATGHNNMAMDRGVYEVARRYVRGASLSEGMLNRVEALIRSFDPCLSCSTHAVGQMPLHIQLVDQAGGVVDELKR
ncbi:Ni/Fe hydrogenase subunit alpha [Oscillatoria laete-virens NRMC-F 0139]|nr:Ni/Fe hydrogenase subunit alpha [Oscillatoria laete-virens]MDL5055436.1 Ni/Fe hydrogenase subunit alpha [Oscillatoria laete-virens NRMC-F 0139]